MEIPSYMQLVRSDGTTEGPTPEQPLPALDASVEGVEILRELLRSGVDVETLPLEIVSSRPGEEAGTERVEFILGPYTLHVDLVRCSLEWTRTYTGLKGAHMFFMDEWDATVMIFEEGGIRLWGDIRRRFLEVYLEHLSSQ